MSGANTSGYYIVTNKLRETEIYLILISGYTPFLKIEVIWDCYKNKIVSDDCLKGKTFNWVLQ